ncbi:MAG: adaptor protein MecA [Acetatifactor sp.]|jgi:adapter protein MecA 1/2|nr:adaptor protein MecA [Acetatifactor sp.]
MKIEKMNENQIRCTLTKEDLASRELKISELAYGSEKAKSLFREMMQQANFEVGFNAEDIPLMIEAIPLNAECLVLIITKVEDPEELDTRFARFSPSVMEDIENEEPFDPEAASDEMMDLFRRIQNSRKAPTADTLVQPAESTGESKEQNLHRMFAIRSLQQVMDVAALVGEHFPGESSLYKDEQGNRYLLVLSQGENCSKEIFDRISNIISEYGSIQRMLPAGISFLEEHYEPLISRNALQALGLTK